MANITNPKKLLAISMFLLAMGGFSQAGTITVGPGAGCDFDTIQAGIDAADDGDTVLVSPGEYVITEPITFRGKAITVKSEAGRDETTIRMGMPADPNRGSVVVFENNETAAAVLDGFTITGGQGCRLWAAELSIFAWGGGGIILNASSGTVRNCAIVDNTSRDGGGGVICIGDKASVTMTNCTIAANLAGKVGSNAPTHVGGGVLVMEGCSATLTDCNITENSSGHAGGGVYCCFQSSSVTLTDCTIGENTTYTAGGGVMCYKSLVTLRDCVIAGNYSTGWGGGVSCETDASAIVINCIISGNSAAGMGGGGLFCWLISSVTLTNCTIWGNSAGQWGGGLGCFDGPSVAVTNSIISGNTAPRGREVSVRNPVTTLTVAYSGIAGGQAGVYVQGGSTLNWGEGNIDADPLFVDTNNEDFHLKSKAGRWDPNSQTWVQDDVTSPCIDVGDPMSPIGWESFPNGGFVNMGAYGGTPEASKSYFGEPVCETIVAGDINGDCKVDLKDFMILAYHWLEGR